MSILDKNKSLICHYLSNNSMRNSDCVNMMHAYNQYLYKVSGNNKKHACGYIFSNDHSEIISQFIEILINSIINKNYTICHVYKIFPDLFKNPASNDNACPSKDFKIWLEQLDSKTSNFNIQNIGWGIIFEFNRNIYYHKQNLTLTDLLELYKSKNLDEIISVLSYKANSWQPDCIKKYYDEKREENNPSSRYFLIIKNLLE